MGEGGWRKLADIGGGNEIWQSEVASFLRYDCGHFSSKWRDDPISAEEATEGASSEDGFLRVIYAVQQRLVAKGIDAWAGSPSPLNDPA